MVPDEAKNKLGFCRLFPCMVCSGHTAFCVLLGKHQLPPPETPSSSSSSPTPFHTLRCSGDATTQTSHWTATLCVCLSPSLSRQGRLVSDDLFSSQHLVFDEKSLNGGMNTGVNIKPLDFPSAVPPLGWVLELACRAAKLSSPMAGWAASTQHRLRAARRRLKGGWAESTESPGSKEQGGTARSDQEQVSLERDVA